MEENLYDIDGIKVTWKYWGSVIKDESVFIDDKIIMTCFERQKMKAVKIKLHIFVGFSVDSWNGTHERRWYEMKIIHFTGIVEIQSQ